MSKKIKKLMIDRGVTVTSLAEKTGYTRAHISNILHGHFKSEPARKAIAEVLQVEPKKLWGKAAA